mgnify:CR=1 FL=1
MHKEKIQEYFRGLEFEASSHQYSHKGQNLNSVSSVIKRYTEPFDADKIAFFVARKRSKDLGYEVSKEEILQEWEDKKNAACDRGNLAHAFGEEFAEIYDSPELPVAKTGFETAIMSFWDNIPDHIQPFLFELKMFSTELGIAGTADMILYNTLTGKFIICDYKTNEDLFKNHKGKKLLAPFKDMLDMPFSKYELQLSMYQILFEQCGFEVEARRIIWLKEDGTYTNYRTRDLTERLIEELK